MINIRLKERIEKKAIHYDLLVFAVLFYSIGLLFLLAKGMYSKELTFEQEMLTANHIMICIKESLFE